MCAIVTIDGKEYATVRDLLRVMDVREPVMAKGYEWWRCNPSGCLCQIDIEATAFCNGYECRKDALGDYLLVRCGNHEPVPTPMLDLEKLTGVPPLVLPEVQLEWPEFIQPAQPNRLGEASRRLWAMVSKKIAETFSSITFR